MTSDDPNNGCEGDYLNTGFVLSFGVLFPELMAHFDETTETTGEYITLHVF